MSFFWHEVLGPKCFDTPESNNTSYYNCIIYFWNSYTEWFNFIIIIHVTNDVFKVFLTRRNPVRY